MPIFGAIFSILDTNMNQFLLSIEHLYVNLGGQGVLKDINLIIKENEQWAIVGPSGSGKTVLAHTLCGKHFYTGKINASFGDEENFNRLVQIVEQQHRFKNIANQADFYYQQRYNSFDAEQTITVREDLDAYLSRAQEGSAGFNHASLLKLLNIDYLLDEPLIQLSNGENKRLQLAKALMQKQKLLILDQPFVGLDIAGRALLKDILDELSKKNIKLLLITSPHDIPGYITHIAEMDRGVFTKTLPKKEYHPDTNMRNHKLISKEALMEANTVAPQNEFEFAVRMVDVNIKYENKNILQHINWEVRKGERWNLSGPNGAGKSTLLSLMTGDNPQAYANEIYLFDQRRDTGESIWDIKRKIGYISPELHLYFDPSATVFQAIASGLFDTIGLFRQLTDDQANHVRKWVQMMGLISDQHKLLSQLSLGEQRLVLLARALIKNPPLLILDEPCQGLDEGHINAFKSIIDMFCDIFQTTLIYVSHYREELPDCISLFLQIENGKIV